MLAIRCHDQFTSSGQRPSVIIRGTTKGHKWGVDSTYLLHFDRVIVSGGGFQYQQLVTCDQWPGFYDFNWVTSEESAVPLLDVQAAAGIAYFTGLQGVTITDFSAADPVMPYVDPPSRSFILLAV